MRGRIWWGLVVVGAWVSPALATVLLQQSPEELLAQSDLVVLGVVEGQRSLRVAGELMTETTLGVEETLRGGAVKTLVLSQLGGREGNVVADVPGDAQLRPGERVVLITWRHRDGRRYLVGMGLGAFHVGPGGKLDQQVEVPRVARDGRLHQGPGRVTMTLEGFRRLARSVP
jgi:hypothetical protein